MHTPETSETIHLINKIFISNCKKNIYLINTARGKSVCTEDLLEAIENDKILGACLDVLEFESTSFEKFSIEKPILVKLINSQKVLLSPHIAGWTHESQEKMATFLIEKISDFFHKKLVEFIFLLNLAPKLNFIIKFKKT